MPTPADQRLLEVLDKWLKSLELHERYSGLDADSYARMQPWPAHERPSRWIIDLARQKTLALRAQLEERSRRGDPQFSEALELMAFLANLVGSEHIERFIPLATAANEQPLTRHSAATTVEAAPASATAAAPSAPAAAPASPAPPATAPPRRSAATAKNQGRPSPPLPADTSPTREMPMAAVTSDLGSTANREGPGVGVTATREMPQFTGTTPRASPAVRSERRPPPPPEPPGERPSEREGLRPSAKNSTKHPARMPAAAKSPAAPKQGAPGAATQAASRGSAAPSRDHAREQVVGDAVRLMQWGRKWYELAELIARMADRPPLGEVRRILKDNKTAIEKKAGRS